MPPRPDASEARAALAAIARQRTELDRMEAALLPLVASADDLVPIKAAQAAMGLGQWAALKRARRGAGVKLDGHWFFRRDYVDKVAAKNVQSACPNASSVQDAPTARI